MLANGGNRATSRFTVCEYGHHTRLFQPMLSPSSLPFIRIFCIYICVLFFFFSSSLLPLLQRQVTVEGCDTFETTSYLEREPARLRLHWLNATRPDEESKHPPTSTDCTDPAAASEQSQTSPMVARLWSLLSADSYKVALAFVGTSLHVTVYMFIYTPAISLLTVAVAFCLYRI